MKPFLIAAASAAALIATSASAQEVGSWYVRGDAGATFADHMAGAGPHSDAGWALSGAAGRSLGNGFRTEAELVYLDGAGRGSDADTTAVAGFANVYYDFNRHGAWQPFVGGGVGVADVMLRSGANPFQHGDDTSFAYQAKVGVAHPFNDHLTGELTYRYIGTTDTRFGSGPTRIGGDWGASLISVGLRWKLGQ